MGKWLQTIIYLVGAAILTHFIPFSSFFRNLDTLIHETGHAVMTLLLSGQVRSIVMHPDHSGETYSIMRTAWSGVPVALAGYMTASLFTVYLFRTYRSGAHKRGLLVVTVIAAISLILFIRGTFGVSWTLGFIVINLVMMGIAGRLIRKMYYLLLAFLSLEESVFGPFQLLLSSFSHPKQVGDATNLANATPLPAALWCFWFTLFAMWCAIAAISAYTGQRGGRRRKASAKRKNHRAKKSM